MQKEAIAVVDSGAAGGYDADRSGGFKHSWLL
jgi:hypothetical protein